MRAETALDHVANERTAAAWVLFDPDGTHIPTEFMPSFGAFPESDQQIGMWQTAEGAGGYDARRTQELNQSAAPREALSAYRAILAKEMK
ncbi:hypothetical protein NOI24_26975 [Neorhizobium galegae]|uniref:hypothetical protein n=1 Tax=Neorhizobium galegae TaxID=399 RepID=UPI0021047A58|nr:hypothetical protein [Neorhizobium galegae]MCQ1774943.1 hypothetical protein [Neorhizobium galegae]MCQ1799782.1 hypothetical protein [Neorhizobium galegae]